MLSICIVATSSHSYIKQQQFADFEDEKIVPFLEKYFNKENIPAILAPFIDPKVNHVTASSDAKPKLQKKYNIPAGTDLSIMIEGDRKTIEKAARLATSSFSNMVWRTDAKIDFFNGKPARDISPEKLRFPAAPFDTSSLDFMECRSHENGFCIQLEKPEPRNPFDTLTHFDDPIKILRPVSSHRGKP